MKISLTLRQLQVLAAVKGGGSLADLAQRLGSTRTGIYQTLNRLAASGHIKMGPPRVVTPKGEKALAGAVDSLKAALDLAQQPTAA